MATEGDNPDDGEVNHMTEYDGAAQRRDAVPR